MSEPTPAITDFIDELRWRGLFNQCTDEDALREHLRTPGRKAYAGFDPTADSYTIGNLVPIMLLVHFQRAGHTPVALMGGGTGLIGDPSGKSAERQLRTEEEVQANVDSQRKIFASVFSAQNGLEMPEIVNNLDWLKGLSYIEALRDVGKHFSVNMMMQKDSVRDRLQNREQGISYTEFSYMILQSYDFLRLYEDAGVTMQMGGSDQWGNIVGGTDLIRRVCASVQARKSEIIALLEGGYPLTDEERERLNEEGGNLHSRYMAAGGYQTVDVPHIIAKVRKQNNSDYTGPTESSPLAMSENFAIARTEWDSFGLTAPLVTKADGGKFGKTESGAVWLSPHRTSPYALYQWCINTADADVVRFLKLFTLLTKDEIEAIEAQHNEAPGKRSAQTRFAEEFVRFLHGADALAGAQAASKALFSGDVKGLDEATLKEVFAETPSSEHPKSGLGGDGLAVLDALLETGLAKSKREAREFLGGGSVSVNGEKCDADRVLTTGDLLAGGVILLRRGKKAWHVARFV